MDAKGRIQGWKEIAAYIGRTERTARRWETQRQLPIRRTPGERRSSVYAIVSELDKWLMLTPPSGEDGDSFRASETVPITTPIFAAGRRPRWLIATVFGGVAMAACIGAVLASRRAEARRTISTALTTGVGRGYHSKVQGVDELYSRGMWLYEQRTLASLRGALQCFLEATAQDSADAPAWSGLANTYTLLGEYSALGILDAYVRARDADEHALALDPTMAEPHANLGFLNYFRVGNVVVADREFDTALSLNPGSAMAHNWFGISLVYRGRFSEAMEHFDTALRIEPGSNAIMANRALALGLSGHRDAGLDILGHLSNADTSPMVAHHMALLAAVEPRRVDLYLRASAHLEALRTDTERQKNIFTDAQRAYRPGSAGEAAVWRMIADSHESDGILRAEAEAALGNKDAAFANIEGLLQSPRAPMGLIVDPFFKSLRDDSRWTRVLAREREMGSPVT